MRYVMVIALFVSAVIVGIAGAFLAHFIQFINPQVFWLDNAVWILAALVLGGLASFYGSILGMVLLFAIFESCPRRKVYYVRSNSRNMYW